MVGAGQHEQAASRRSPVSTRADHAPTMTTTSLLGEQVTTTIRERPQLGHSLVNRAAGPR